ncbi:MAG: HprK-related kinase A, partial [Planctomycetales bacterium]|nr:HprK-related kinase A [Planctomycetales bacterium]
DAAFGIEGMIPFNPFPREMAVAYFEWGLNWCVANLANHLFLMHAATLERNGHAVIIAGLSGAGKSTLAAGLAFDGWRLLSDEFALLSPASMQLSALARPISLKNESIDLISARKPNAVWGPPSVGERKGLIRHLRPERTWIDRVAEPATPAWLLLLDFQSAAAPQLKPVAKGAMMMQLIPHAFNYYMLGQRGFQALGELVDRCECFRFTYGDLDAGITALRQLSESHDNAS